MRRILMLLTLLVVAGGSAAMYIPVRADDAADFEREKEKAVLERAKEQEQALKEMTKQQEKAAKEAARAQRKMEHAAIHAAKGPFHNGRAMGNVFSARASQYRAAKALQKAADAQAKLTGD